MDDDALLDVESVSIAFGGVQAVADASLRVARGSICALIGPNGAGKTTLFSLVSGFHRPDAGWVRFAGRDITGLAPHQVCRLGVGRTFQIVQPFAGQSVLENIAIGSHLHRAPRREALAQAAEIAGYADGVIVGSALVRTLLDAGSDRAAGLAALRALTADLADGVRRG